MTALDQLDQAIQVLSEIEGVPTIELLAARQAIQATIAQQAETIRLQSNLDPDAFFRFIADEKVKELEEECQLERDASWIFFIMALAGWLAAFAVAFAYGLRVVLK